MEIVALAEVYREAEEETRARIRRDVEGASPAVAELLEEIAKRLFEDFNSGELRKQKKPSKVAEAEFKAKTGFTLAAYIKEQRMLTAKRLLETSGLRVGEVATRTRVASRPRFSSLFAKWEGRSPREVQRAAKMTSENLDRYLQAWYGPRAYAVADPEICRTARQINEAQEHGTGPLQKALVERTVACLERRLGEGDFEALREAQGSLACGRGRLTPCNNGQL